MRGGFRREESMRVAMLVGVLMVNVIAGLYQSGWVADGEVSNDAGLVQAYEDILPPPPNWP
jgi:hypothetical protein